MKTAIVYTVLSIVNFLGFAVGVGLLPPEVPTHFDITMTADVIGSPWVYLALPGAAALISGGMWASLAQKKNRALTAGFLAAIGIVLVTIGWAFFALAASGVKIGEKADFPVALVIALPISLLGVWLGNYMPRIEPNRVVGIRTRATLKSEEVWEKTHRFGGYAFFAAGVVSALFALFFGCIPALSAVEYAAIAVSVAAVLAAAVASVVYAAVLARKRAEGEEGEQN